MTTIYVYDHATMESDDLNVPEPCETITGETLAECEAEFAAPSATTSLPAEAEAGARAKSLVPPDRNVKN